MSPQMIYLEIFKGEFNCHYRLMGLRQDEWWILQIFNGLYAHMAIFFFFLKHKNFWSQPFFLTNQKESLEHLWQEKKSPQKTVRLKIFSMLDHTRIQRKTSDSGSLTQLFIKIKQCFNTQAIYLIMFAFLLCLSFPKSNLNSLEDSFYL